MAFVFNGKIFGSLASCLVASSLLVGCGNSGGSGGGGPGVAPADVVDFSTSRFTPDPAKTWVASKDSKIPDSVLSQFSNKRQNETCNQMYNPSVVNSLRKAIDPRLLRLGRVSKTLSNFHLSPQHFQFQGTTAQEIEVVNADQGLLRTRTSHFNDVRLGGYSGPIFKDNTQFPAPMKWEQRQVKLNKSEHFVNVSVESVSENSNTNEPPIWAHPQLLEYLNSNSSNSKPMSCSWTDIPNQEPRVRRVSVGTYTLNSGAKVQAILRETSGPVEGKCGDTKFIAQERFLNVITFDIPGETLQDYCYGESLLFISQRVDQNKTISGNRQEVTDATVAAD